MGEKPRAGIVRIAAFADLQGNPRAAEAILGALRRLGDCEAYALGNAVGAGPDPAGTVALLRRAGVHLVLGPRDLACLGKPPREDLREEGDRNARLLSPADVGWLRRGGPARRLIVDGRAILLTADAAPSAGAARLVLHPSAEARVEERAGVVFAGTGRADDPSGEASYVVFDSETGTTAVRHAAWDVDALGPPVRRRT